MTSEAVQKILKEEINSLNFEIPAEVFQFTLTQIEAAQYLETHPSVPFILRISPLEGYFTLDIPAKDRNSICRTLVSQSKVNENEFGLYGVENDVLTEGSNLKDYIKKYWDPEQKCILSDSELAERKNEVWENYKHLLQKQLEERRENEKREESLQTQAEKRVTFFWKPDESQKFYPLKEDQQVSQADFDHFMSL